MPKNNKSKKNYLISLIECFFIIVVLFLTAFNLQNYSKQEKVLGAKIENVDLTEDKINFLKSTTEKNPLYFDAYIELIKLNIEESNTKDVTKYLEIAQKINPNSQAIKSIKETLNILN
jgi:hypothetical protein